MIKKYIAKWLPLIILVCIIVSCSKNNNQKNNPDKEYVVFCGVGGQGTLSTKTMQDMGIKNVKNITGGIAEWEKLEK